MIAPMLPPSGRGRPLPLLVLLAALPLAPGAALAAHGRAPRHAAIEAATRPRPPPEVRALRRRLEGLVLGHGETPTATSIGYALDVAERIEGDFGPQSAAWRARAARFLDLAERGVDPFVHAKGEIVPRGYRSPISRRAQGYAVYVPPTYDPRRAYPLMVVLHGGSSNGNLYLGVVLGNNESWKKYDRHLWDTYTPRWTPDMIVAAPDGYGQVGWRFMGEQDVLDVIRDVRRTYNVDRDRVVLSGLSSGGLGAYTVGSRHASEFSVVQAIAGAPSWRMFTGEELARPLDAALMRPLDAIELADNWHGTDFRYYHGTTDTGPMRPGYVHRLDASLNRRHVPHRSVWYEAGHDVLYLAYRQGRIFDELAAVRRDPRPSEVHLVSGDYRAARQHWVEVTRFHRYPELARVVAKAGDGRVDVRCENVRALALDLAKAPLDGDTLEVHVNGALAWAGPRSSVGARIDLVDDGGFRRGVPEDTGLAKRPGSSGPITDAYFGRMVHVFGTRRPEHAEALEKIARRGARGWPTGAWTVEQEVLPDTAITHAIASSAHLVLYGTPGDNRVLDRITDRLPIRVTSDAVVLGRHRHTGRGVGTRFVYPNPEAPARYVIVAAAPTLDGVQRGQNLPDFVPDYVVYDARSTAFRPRYVPAHMPPARGFFDARWRLGPG
jgi:poly(3-hydroxybutyrate) depolymerase